MLIEGIDTHLARGRGRCRNGRESYFYPRHDGIEDDDGVQIRGVPRCTGNPKA